MKIATALLTLAISLSSFAHVLRAPINVSKREVNGTITNSTVVYAMVGFVTTYDDLQAHKLDISDLECAGLECRAYSDANGFVPLAQPFSVDQPAIFNSTDNDNGNAAVGSILCYAIIHVEIEEHDQHDNETERLVKEGKWKHGVIVYGNGP